MMNGELSRYSQYLSSLGQAQNSLIIDSYLKLINKKDDYICKHGIRVALISVAIGKNAKINQIDLLFLEHAALFHDIGKLPLLKIVRKNGNLTDDEWEIMKTHTTIPITDSNGYSIKTTGKKVIMMIKYHHEKMNGQGYPEGLKGEEIPLGAQIIAIADVYDALTSDRPYRPAVSHEKAIQIMTGPEFNGHFNPDLFDTARECLQAITL
jgi:HD-GYP domain-containing protein (c-di-GMP phosphodiesterase class II)